ncbi:MAG: anti-sigma factor [Sphingobacteriales bacterium]|nr:MAG: anti-sigma factor [Sphingobacteriales bacterium]
MKDIKAYIESGILELYVLGDVSAEEKLQVQEMVSKHPEVKAELDAIETSLENYAAANAVDPSEKVRDRVLNSMLINLGDDRIFPGQTTREKDNVAALPARPSNFYKYAFAACLALLLVSIAVLVGMYDSLQESKMRLVALQLDNQQFSKRVNLMDLQLGVFRDSTFRFIKLKGTPKTPASVMTIAWSSVKRKVMIDMADLKLPENDKNHQYQLWAIVNGKPVDLGVFDAASARADTADMKEMKPVAAPQAFAVTLEKRGGSANPTMEEMVVISNI